MVQSSARLSRGYQMRRSNAVISRSTSLEQRFPFTIVGIGWVSDFLTVAALVQPPNGASVIGILDHAAVLQLEALLAQVRISQHSVRTSVDAESKQIRQQVSIVWVRWAWLSRPRNTVF